MPQRKEERKSLTNESFGIARKSGGKAREGGGGNSQRQTDRVGQREKEDRDDAD
jgi:hypothetical protein